MATIKTLISNIPFITFRKKTAEQNSAQNTTDTNDINIGSVKATQNDNYTKRLTEKDKTFLTIDENLENETSTNFEKLESVNNINLFAEIDEDIDLMAYCPDIKAIKDKLVGENGNYEIKNSSEEEGDIDKVLQLRWRKVAGCSNGEFAYFIILSSNPIQEKQDE